VADWTTGSDEVTQMLLDLKSKSIPVLAIFPANEPNRPIVLRDLVTAKRVLKAIERAGPSRVRTAMTK
jgi:thiol:disulfide interchange protein